MIKANKSKRLIRFVFLFSFFVIISLSSPPVKQIQYKNSYFIFFVRYLVDRERISTFAATDSAALPIDQRTRAELLLLYTIIAYMRTMILWRNSNCCYLSIPMLTLPPWASPRTGRRSLCGSKIAFTASRPNDKVRAWVVYGVLSSFLYSYTLMSYLFKTEILRKL